MPIELSVHEVELATVERELARLSVPVSGLLFDRARALDALGRNDEAEAAYLELLRVDSSHWDGLTALAALLLKSGHKSAAKTLLTRAVAVQPENAAAHANLATLLCDEDLPQAQAHYAEALRLDPGERGAHRGLAILALRADELARAEQHARLGFRGQAEAWPFRGTGQPIAVLFVQSARGGNVPLEHFLDDRVFLKWTFAAEFFDPELELPPHDLILNAIGDADLCGPALDAATRALFQSTAPIINPPARVRATGRAANSERLRRLPGVVTARTEEWSRAALLSPDAPSTLEQAGFVFPLLLRSPGFHTGEHFEKVAGPAALASALTQLPGATLLVMEFIDTRDSDGNFRKYRVMMIDGKLLPLHLAVSNAWKVHYFTAQIAEQYRAEDEAFLNDMSGLLGPDVLRALTAVRDELGLDYGGIDFALDAARNVIVFEANATMVILPPSADPRSAYRVAPVQRAQEAVRGMLLSRARSSGGAARHSSPSTR
jgi:hypothetical protein